MVTESNKIGITYKCNKYEESCFYEEMHQSFKEKTDNLWEYLDVIVLHYKAKEISVNELGVLQ